MLAAVLGYHVALAVPALHKNVRGVAPDPGLTLHRFTNTALAGEPASSEIIRSLEALPTCDPATCGAPSSMLVTGRIAPSAAGNYGFQVTADPPLSYPSPEGYARLWIHDHLLYPRNTTGKVNAAGAVTPLWVPLPPRALTEFGTAVEHLGAANLSSYEVRLEFVCLSARGCARNLRVRWAAYPRAAVDLGRPQSAACRNGTFEQGVGCPGNDLPDARVTTATLAECCGICGADKRCAVATWSEVDSRCRMKSSGACRRAQPGVFFLRLRPDLPPLPGSHGAAAPASSDPAPQPEYKPIPADVLVPTQGAAEVQRRALARRLEDGWGTFYRPSMFAWALLPESFLVKLGLYQLSTGRFLPSEGLTVNKGQLQEGAQLAVKPGMHSYDQSYAQASLVWLDGSGGRINISVAATVDANDSSLLTIVVTSPPDGRMDGRTRTNHSDYALVVGGNYTHGRGGVVHAASDRLTGASPGLRTSTVRLLQGTPAAPMPNASSAAGAAYFTVQMGPTGRGEAVVLSTDGGDEAAAVIAKTAAYRRAEAQTLDKYGPEWGEVKDAMQTVLMWSFTYDPKTSLVAPEFQYDGPGGFSNPSVDGDTTATLFCWDGSFASYMTSLDALDLALSNLIQIVKMRTSAGFVPSYSAGSLKSRDRSNPPVTSKVLHEITRRWGASRTQWAVELCFDDLLNWNTWMYSRRREAPLGLLSWGSDPYPYAPDGTQGAYTGGGGGGATLESGLDNGPIYASTPFNRTGLWVQDEYDPGYTGLFLMDCQALVALAGMVNRPEAAKVVQQRFDTVNAAMGRYLWNESAGYHQNKLSADLSPIEMMAPTNFYPFLVGPESGPSESQAVEAVVRHLTNNTRFGVWPSAAQPTDHPPPPVGTRPLIQWWAKKCARGYPCPGSPHVLCARQSCNAGQAFGNLVQRLHSKVRFEGIGLVAPPDGESPTDLLALYDYNCTGPNATAGDMTLAAAGWSPRPGDGGPCARLPGPSASMPALYVYTSRVGPSAADLVELEVWYRPGDHYLVASDAGKRDAAASGYRKVETLGFVYPPPGTVNATSHFGLPSISKDDQNYVAQDYWRGRIWGPMVQLTYWGLSQYRSPEVKGAMAGLVAQSRALLLHEWRGYKGNGGNGSFAGLGRNVFENYGADTGNGYVLSSSAAPLYSWGALTGFIGLQASGFYEPLGTEEVPTDGRDP